jgi:hypothetical protein
MIALYFFQVQNFPCILYVSVLPSYGEHSEYLIALFRLYHFQVAIIDI